MAFSDPVRYEEVNTDPFKMAQVIANADHATDIKLKKGFSKFAYCMAWFWVILLARIIWLQGIATNADPYGFKLEEWDFRIVFGGLTTSIFGFAYLVGKYLFPTGGAKRR